MPWKMHRGQASTAHRKQKKTKPHAEALREACGREHRDAFAFEYRPCSFVDIAEHADAFSAVFADPSRHWAIMAVYNRVPAALRDLRARNIRGG